MEKINNKIKIVVIFIVAIILILLLVVIKRFIIYSNLEKVSKEKTNRNNFYCEKTFFYDGNVEFKCQIYYKDKKMLMNEIAHNNLYNVIYYIGDRETIQILEQNNIKKIEINKTFLPIDQIDVFNFYTYVMKNINKYKLALTTKIETENYNEIECYVIEPEKNWKLWINKENGVVIKEMKNENIIEYNYKFNIVTDEDIVRPDVNESEKNTKL